MGPRLIVLGWDSATFDVVDPLKEQGRLPVISSLTARGFTATLASTWPPMTDCAWTSAFTGRNPAGHGIWGSWYRAPGAYACRYYSSRDRRTQSVWELSDGTRWLVWNVPMTFPPTPVSGAMVAGYAAPPGARFCLPDSLLDSLGDRWPVDDLLDSAPHSTLESFLEDLIRSLRAQAEAIPWAAREADADCIVAVWPQVDRAQHFMWRFRETNHPLASAVDRVYEEIDRATGAVIEAFPDATVIVLSDHGAGDLRGDVNVAEWLATNGYAAYGSRGGSRLLESAWKLPPGVRRVARRLAPALARKTVGATLDLGSFDWPGTRAFMGFHGDLWLNLQGREPAGTVPDADAQSTLDEIADGLLAIEDPSTGARVFKSVHKRNEIYSGPAINLAPDAILDSWSAGYRVAPGRDRSDAIVVPPSPLAGVNEAWSSDHRPAGIFVAAGPRIASGSSELSIYDVAPTILALLEQAVPGDLDGRVATEALAPEWVRDHPVVTGGSAGERATGGGYSDDEASAVADHLRDLGYIE
jgi:predicted AlkP superfamily phosphohydrolase/phosphomutase